MICFNCAKRGVGMHKHHRNNQMAHLHHEGNRGVSWDVMGAQGISLICGGRKASRAQSARKMSKGVQAGRVRGNLTGYLVGILWA